MLQSKRDSRIIGILILSSFVFGILSVSPSVDSEQFMELTAGNANQTIGAAVFQFLMGCSYVVITLLFYTRIKYLFPNLALTALVFRFLSIGLSWIGTILLGSVLIWSQQYLELGKPDEGIWKGVGETLKQTRDMINHGWMILSLGIGNLMLYIGFFKGKLISRHLSLLGIFGTAFSCFASVLILFQLLKVISVSYLMMNLPTAIFELILAGWLIWRGLED